MKTIVFNEINSTNEFAKTVEDIGEDVLIVAKRQTAGKGTKGRSFSSEEGGIYLSHLRFSPDLAENAFYLTAGAAVAVVNTLEAFGIEGVIKWPNDVLAGGKKICGILAENVIRDGAIYRSVVGIGLNVNNEISENLKDVAVSMKDIKGEKLSYESVLATLAYNLTLPVDMERYREKSVVIGKELLIIKGDKVYHGAGEEILPDGRLKLKSGEILSAAEVTLRI